MKDLLQKVGNLFKNFFKYGEKHPIKASMVVLVPVLIAMIGYDAYDIVTKPEKVSYEQYQEDLNWGRIDTIYYSPDSETMTYTLHNEETKDMGIEDRKKYSHSKSEYKETEYPAGDNFREKCLKKGVLLEIKKDSSPMDFVMSVLGMTFYLALIVMMYLMLRQFLGGGDKSVDPVSSDVKFKDVIGHDDIIEDLQFIVNLMKNKDRGDIEIPKGILFSGEPGTGKTMLAKAIAGECEIPFLYANASSFIEKYVGVGAKRVRNLFDKARKLAPCVVFIDEIDAIGVSRNKQISGTSEDRQTLNALLQDMDGFNGKDNILVIGATNDADCLDKALMRSGRFDRQIVISPPKDWRVREQLFNHYLGEDTNNIDVTKIAKQTVGFTGADIASVVNEAKLIALAKNMDINTDCLEEAVDKRLFKGNRVKEQERNHDLEVVAYHEAGHAVMSYICGEPISRVSIVGITSGVGGMVMQEDTQSQFRTKSGIIKQVMINYGGRCSEHIKYGDITTGAISDITNATKLLKDYVSVYGFCDEVGLVNLSVLEESAYDTDIQLREIVVTLAKKAEEHTEKLLRLNYGLVEKLARVLLEEETLSGNEINELFDGIEIKG